MSMSLAAPDDTEIANKSRHFVENFDEGDASEKLESIRMIVRSLRYSGTM